MPKKKENDATGCLCWRRQKRKGFSLAYIRRNALRCFALRSLQFIAFTNGSEAAVVFPAFVPISIGSFRHLGWADPWL